MDFKHEELIKIYIDLLQNYNKTHRITAFKNKEDILHNIQDSIYPLRFLDFTPKNVADIGSGAGFPGIFLALNLPQTKVNLYEPLHKKAAFLHLAVTKMKLQNVIVKNIRIENENTEQFDLIVSRAMSEAKTLVNLCLNVKNKNTIFLLYKGSQLPKEDLSLYESKIHQKDRRKYLILKEKHDS